MTKHEKIKRVSTILVASKALAYYASLLSRFEKPPPCIMKQSDKLLDEASAMTTDLYTSDQDVLTCLVQAEARFQMIATSIEERVYRKLARKILNERQHN